MSQKMLELRVRPPRVAVLINEEATHRELVEVIRFLSQLWGGKYCPIFSVSSSAPDELTEYRLKLTRPDFVYGWNIDDDLWVKSVNTACQPRKYSRLTSTIALRAKMAISEELISADRPLVSIFAERKTGLRQSRRVAVVSADENSDWSAFCAASFGVHHPNLKETFRDELIPFHSSDPVDYINLHKDFVDGDKTNWLDATAVGLDLLMKSFLTSPPTIVLVGDGIKDLVLYWNLRMTLGNLYPPWIIPISLTDLRDSKMITALREWLLSFSRSRKITFCQVMSETIPKSQCNRIATRLREALRGTSFKCVDSVRPPSSFERVHPYEYTVTWPGTLRKRRLEFIPPSPKICSPVPSGESWFVDVVKDLQTGRALKEMQYPESPVVQEILNAPSPPQIAYANIPIFGDGFDSLSIRCSSGKDLVRFHVPSANEILEEIIREQGYQVVQDEKRNSYLPTIRRFGGLHRAAVAFTGETGKIIEALSNGEIWKVSKIKGKCELGNGKLKDGAYKTHFEPLLSAESPRLKRIARERYAKYARRDLPEEMTLQSLLEYWSRKDIAIRSWEIGPCKRCNKTSNVAKLNIQKQVRCPHCGDEIPMKEQTSVAYSLTRNLFESLKEGIVPVVLTGWFLRNLTNRGFFWLLGLKYSKGDNKGDIDIVACCDGLLVFAECKTLQNTRGKSTVWKEVETQFLEMAVVAEECGAGLVVLSVQNSTIPTRVERSIKKALTGKVPFLLLNNQDLAKGFRLKDESDPMSRLSLGDLLTPPFLDKPDKLEEGERVIDLGWGTFTKGIDNTRK